MTVKGSREITDLDEEEFYATRERNHGEFSRTVTLPYEVDADKVEARYENGVLVIEMPRAEVDKPRKIKVKAA
jgi:HSP20 family protein